jgi:hypothetical protein
VFAAESLGFHNFVFASIADLHWFWHHIAQDIYVIVKGTSCSSGLFIPRFFSLLLLRSIGNKRHGKSTSPRVHSSLVVALGIALGE